MNKFRVIFNILRTEYFVVITDKGFHASTPKFGHERYWKEATRMFKGLKRSADRSQGDFK